MTTVEIAGLFNAKRIGRKRYQARCVAHTDRSPSLVITEGREGRTLLKCWAGCSLANILSPVGLRVRDLFGESRTLSPAEKQSLQKQEAAAVERAGVIKAITRNAFDRERLAEIEMRRWGAALANLPENDEREDALTRLFHLACAEFQEAEAWSLRLVRQSRKPWNGPMRGSEVGTCRCLAWRLITHSTAPYPVVGDVWIFHSSKGMACADGRMRISWHRRGFRCLIRNSTEADDHALLVTFLAGVGTMVGRGAYFTVEDTRHSPNLFVTVVGDSAKSRKGTGTDRVLRMLTRVDSNFVDRNKASGLSSGEGLIHAVRDPRVEETEIKERGMPPRREMQTVDPGVLDKRLLIVESEFAQALQAAGREGNILSPILRDSWDGKPLRVLARSNKDSATGAHISIIANITADELKRLLKANGMGNRFLWVCAKRSKLLPHGGEAIPEEAFEQLAGRIREAVEFASAAGEITWDIEAKAAWARVYEPLSAPARGLFGSMTARGDAQCRRLALLYALLDRATQISMPHLRAALEVWSYCEDSVRYLFGDAIGDETADAILRSLAGAGQGMTTTEISGIFGRHKSTSELQRALNMLRDRGLVVSYKEQTSGAPTVVWTAVSKKAN